MTIVAGHALRRKPRARKKDLLETLDTAVIGAAGQERCGRMPTAAYVRSSPLSWRCLTALAVLSSLFQFATPRLFGADAAGNAELGGEMQKLEKETLQTPGSWAKDANPDWENLLEKPLPAVVPPPAAPEVKPQPAPEETPVAVKEARFEGDAKFLEALGLAARIRQEAVGQSLTEAQILKLATKYREICVQEGFYLALITAQPADRDNGVLVFDVDAGRIGKMTFCDSRGAASWERDLKVPYSGKYFSEAQLRRQMSNLAEGAIFDYNEFYRSVFAVNAHPDLTMDTDLKVRKDFTSGPRRRFADMTFYVQEQRPVHGTVEFKNTGTEATDEWRASATLQHLNLTRRGDVLTLNTIASTDFNALRSFAGSYYLPWHAGSGNAVTLYGGYSEMAANDIVPLFDLTGQGSFLGAQFSFMLTRSEKDIVTLSFSGVSRFIQNTMTTLGCDNKETQALAEKVTIVPVSATLSYSAGKPDQLGGRNFLTSQTSFNAGKFLGGSGDDDIAKQRAAAGADYVIERLQAARLQPLFGRAAGKSDRRAQWILFVKLDGQYSTSALIPVEQKAIGGMDSVRGYPERETLGDNGISGTVELRTPLFSGLFPRKKGEESIDNFQVLAFADAGRVSMKNPAEGEEKSQSLLGVGAGARLALTSHSQFRFDWGFPLKKTDASDSSGRAHISVQAQF